MATVTYKHQPAIHKTRGSVPLAGTSHVYTVSKVLWAPPTEAFLGSLLMGRSLHVCCGASKLGDVRLDNDPTHSPDLLGDMSDMSALVGDDAFETVLIDPPYNSKLGMMHAMLTELARVASQRIIFQHWFIPATPLGLYKKAQNKFALSAVYVWQPRTYFGRVNVISVFDRRPEILDREPAEMALEERLDE